MNENQELPEDNEGLENGNDLDTELPTSPQSMPRGDDSQESIGSPQNDSFQQNASLYQNQEAYQMYHTVSFNDSEINEYIEDCEEVRHGDVDSDGGCEFIDEGVEEQNVHLERPNAANVLQEDAIVPEHESDDSEMEEEGEMEAMNTQSQEQLQKTRKKNSVGFLRCEAGAEFIALCSSHVISMESAKALWEWHCHNANMTARAIDFINHERENRKWRPLPPKEVPVSFKTLMNDANSNIPKVWMTVETTDPELTAQLTDIDVLPRDLDKTKVLAEVSYCKVRMNGKSSPSNYLY